MKCIKFHGTLNEIFSALGSLYYILYKVWRYYLFIYGASIKRRHWDLDKFMVLVWLRKWKRVFSIERQRIEIWGVDINWGTLKCGTWSIDDFTTLSSSLSYTESFHYDANCYILHFDEHPEFYNLIFFNGQYSRAGVTEEQPNLAHHLFVYSLCAKNGFAYLNTDYKNDY